MPEMVSAWFQRVVVSRYVSQPNPVHAMRKLYFSLLFTFFATVLSTTAQTRVEKIVVVNGGRFEFSPPFSDFVTVGVYDLQTRSYALIDTIDDQSVQDVITYGAGNFYRAYVLSQSHVTSYDLFTGQRLAQVSISGGSKLSFTSNRTLGNIIVSRGFGTPSGAARVVILDKDNLSTVASINGIPDEVHSATVVGTKAYVSVPGNFMSDTGKLAIIDLTNNQLQSVVNLGRTAKGISSIFYYANKLYALSSNGYRSGDGKLHELDLNGTLIRTKNFGISMNGGIGQRGDTIHASISNRGSMSWYKILNDDIDTNHLEQEYAAAKYDTINGGTWFTTPNYSTNGKCYFYEGNRNPIKVDSFNVGISPEAIAVGYYTMTSSITSEFTDSEPFIAYPNPTHGKLYVKYSYGEPISYQIINSVGQVVLTGQASSEDLQFNGLDLTDLPSGQYIFKSGALTKRIAVSH